MKKKNIVILVGVILILLIGGLVYFYGPKLASQKLDNGSAETKDSNKTDENGKSVKGEINQSEKIDNENEGKTTPTITTNLPILSGVSLTVYLSVEPSFSQDGKTVVPAQSIQPYLFPQGSGVYSLQKKVGDSWLDVASNVSYSGHGGIAGAYAEPSEDSINYRAVKLEKGAPVSISKIFVITRSEITDGAKTYN